MNNFQQLFCDELKHLSKLILSLNTAVSCGKVLSKIEKNLKMKHLFIKIVKSN